MPSLQAIKAGEANWGANMELLASYCRGSQLDPWRYGREADEALARGDRREAAVLIEQAFLAFDLCAATCEQVRRLGRACWE